jgi:catechol 2,3-dioxygenase-like lactoylglutathione lyase family enzyme
MMVDAMRPARRVLHVCFCCRDVDGPIERLTEAFGLRETMRSSGTPTSGAVLGLDRDVRGIAAFVYDHRGPRAAPAIEVQSWIDPPLHGQSIVEPSHAGLRALGIAVPSLDDTRSVLHALGMTTAPGVPTATFGSPAACLTDADGMALDVVEDPALAPGTTRLRHVRVTCHDLARSSRWYEALGFERAGGPSTIEDAGVVLVVQRLRLPDEPTELVLTEWRLPRSHGRHYDQPNHAGWYRFALGVDDTRASFDAMSAAGWEFDRAPLLITLDGTPVPDMWITFTTDPDGVPVELVQRPRDAFVASHPASQEEPWSAS